MPFGNISCNHNLVVIKTLDGLQKQFEYTEN